MIYFVELDKTISKFIWKNRDLKINTEISIEQFQLR